MRIIYSIVCLIVIFYLIRGFRNSALSFAYSLEKEDEFASFAGVIIFGLLLWFMAQHIYQHCI
jgi:hypothetical protein